MDISIIVPVYNVEKYLKDCLDSLLEQDFIGEYEIICINDGSIDNSLQILKEYEKTKKNIVVIDKINEGLSEARNTGMINAKGEYLMFLDSDDYLSNDKVLSLLFEEVKKGSLDFVVADFEYDYEDKVKNHRQYRVEKIKNMVMTGRQLYDIGIRTTSITSVVWNKLYKREFLYKNNLYFYKGIIHEDMEFTPKVYYLASRVKYIDEVIVMYRQRDGSIMSKVNNDKLDDYLLIADSVCQFNKSYNSDTLNNVELYMYVSLIRKFKFIDDGEVLKLKNIIKEKNIMSKFFKSSRLKYKVFGLLYVLNLI